MFESGLKKLAIFSRGSLAKSYREGDCCQGFVGGGLVRIVGGGLVHST